MNKTAIRSFLLVAFTLLYSGSVKGQSDYKLEEQDSLALVAFYNATDGPNWTSNQDGFGFADLSTEWQDVYDGRFNHWLDGPVKDWFGVKVEKRPITGTTDSTYRVTWLWPVIGRRTDGQNRLKGYVPREVGLLTALEQFRVNGNSGFTWTELPDDLYQPTLIYLDIEAAWFGGGISDAFRNCTSIGKMNFRYNYIDYMPTLDFLDADALYNLQGAQWFYSTRLSFAIIEKTIDYFYTISPNPKEFTVEYRDLFDVGDELEVVGAVGSPVELECTSAGEHEEYITYQWFKNGLSMFGKTGRTLSFSSVKESDYADYTVRITNDYVKEYDDNSNYGEVFTKPIHLVPAPVAPEVEWAKTSYNGKEVILRFSKPMDTGASGFEGFTIHAGSRLLSATAAKTSGRLKRDFILTLDQPVQYNETVTIDYSGSGVIDSNSGVLSAFADTSVMCLVRKEPSLVSAATTKDGSGIQVMFDNYIDQNSINAADFTVTRDGNNTISTAVLMKGELDEDISKGVLLILSDPVTDSSEVLSVSYTRGELSGLLSGVVNSSEDVVVTNQISLELTEVLLTFEDGSNSFEDVVIQGSWRIDPLQMYDDGTHGDTVSGDHNWATTSSMVDDKYTWDVLSRTRQITYDTVRTEDPVTGIITYVVTPVDVNNDSVTSEAVVLEFIVAGSTVSGRTSFGVMNIPVTFNLTTDQPSDEVYLMGIDDDWGLGLPMALSGGTSQYSVIVEGNTEGDLIQYNYRNGNVWENQTVESRNYTVKKDGNIINDIFGVFTSGTGEIGESNTVLYPNPVRNILYVTGLDEFRLLEIYNPSGQLVRSAPLFSDTFQGEVSGFRPGIYMVKLYGAYSHNLFIKFIKY